MFDLISPTAYTRVLFPVKVVSYSFPRIYSIDAIRRLVTCILGLALVATANAETKLVKVGNPLFDVTGGQAVIPAANPGTLSTWLRNVDRVLEDVHGGTHITLNNACRYCPLEPHDGPYDQEMRQGLVSAGYLLTDAFIQDDLASPATLFVPTVVTPSANAPRGPSFDNPDGPVIPNDIFPLTALAKLFNSGREVWSTLHTAHALDTFVGSFTDSFGETHDLDFTGLNYSHLTFHMINSRHPGQTPDGAEQAIGLNQVTKEIRDVNGNGWDVIEEYTIVAADTNIPGDLNYNGELDLGDLNIMTQNVALMPTDGHEFSEAQLRLDMNGDQSVDVSDVHHWVTDLKSTFVGDTNLDGEVRFDDFLALSANFGQAGGWAEGDFDSNGRVDFPDFLALSTNFGVTAEASAASVPEPAGLTVAVFGLLGLIGFRRRR